MCYSSELKMQNSPKNSQELDQLISEPNEATIEAVSQQNGDFAVLGAGGKMGFHHCMMLRKALEASGQDRKVYAVSRFSSVRDRSDFEKIGCNVLAADLSDPEQLNKLPDVPNVFFLAGVKFGTAHDPQLLEKMNVQMPRMVAERFQKSSIVALSTGCVYSFVSPESGGSVEEDQTDPPGDYAISCKGREDAFVSAGQNYGTQSALIRLNYSIDLRYGVLVDIAQKVKSGIPVDVSMGYVNLIWQGDAIQHILQSLKHVSNPPNILNITGPQIHKVRDLAEGFAQRFGNEAKITGDEAPTAWLNNPSKSHKLFGKPKVSIDTMMDWVADWLKSDGELLGKPTHFETRDGKY